MSENYDDKEEMKDFKNEEEMLQEFSSNNINEAESIPNPSGNDNSYEMNMNTTPYNNMYNNMGNFGNMQNDFNNDKARQQVEKERIKFENKRAKAAKKLTKKAAKKEDKKKKTHGVVYRTVCMGVSAIAFGLVATGTIYLVGDELGIFNTKGNKTTTVISKTSTSNTNDKPTTLGVSDSKNNSKAIVTDVSNIVEDVMPSIVAITSKQLVQSGYNDLYEYFFGYGYGSGNDNGGYEEQSGAGSGIIIGQNDTELLIVTNNHVVKDADSLSILFIDDETVDAYVKGTSATNDLAVVAVKLSDIKQETLESIKIATLGDSDDLEVGEGTIAIGNALGYGQSVTTGVVSALDRTVSLDEGDMTLIQTDAAINPGNSGGALLNMNGEVIGINAANYSSSTVEGMGFAIPVSSVEDVIKNLMNKETRDKVSEEERGYLNIYGRDVTEELSETYDAPRGVLVVEVLEGGAASKAKIEKSDVITAINGQEVASMEELTEELEYYKKGEKVTLTIQYMKDKEYVEKDVKITLGGEME